VTPTELALDALATFRLQRLIGVDTITEKPRERALDGVWRLHAPTGLLLGRLVDCAWCRAPYAAAAVLVLHKLPGGRAVRNVLALAAAAALLAVTLDPAEKP